MPDHVHALIAFKNTGKSINTIVGNGKRFIAYDIVERLKQEGLNDILESLSGGVNSTDRSRNKKHEVFEPSFDWKECNDEHLVEQKLKTSMKMPAGETIGWLIIQLITNTAQRGFIYWMRRAQFRLQHTWNYRILI